jgi:hypothetical protein
MCNINGAATCRKPRSHFSAIFPVAGRQQERVFLFPREKRMKLRLDQNGLTDSFFEDTRLLGIVAPIKDYMFCRQLNSCLRLDFRINNQIEIQVARKHRNYYFRVYQYPEPRSSLTHYVYNNQFEGEYLLPEFRHLDFLWLLKGDVVYDHLLRDLQDAIKRIGGVQLVTEIPSEKIRSKENLVL